MDYLKELGELALGSRLKRLSDTLMREVAIVYNECNIEFEPVLMPTLNFISNNDGCSVTQVSQQLGISQPAATQFISQLSKLDYVKLTIDRADSRRKAVQLTAKGKTILNKLKPIWVYIENEVKHSAKKSNFMNTVNEFETELIENSLSRGILSRMQSDKHAQLKIVDFTDKYKEDVKRLNYEWLEKYFAVEPVDVKSLSNPRKEIIDKGGYIFIALLNNEVVGTVSLLKLSNKKFEVGKMAVTEKYQGKKIGQYLMGKCIEKSRQLQLDELILYSNTKLAPAVNLYFKNGFRVIPIEDNIPYKRSNIKMELKLKHHAN